METTIYSIVTDFTKSEDYFEFSTFSSYVESTTASLNITEPGQKVQLALYDILMPIIGFIIIVLNLAVVISSGLILKKGSEPRATYLFLGNVALSDLTTAVAVILGNSYPKKDRTQLICAFSLGLIVSSTLVSIYSVALIAIDRYLYIIHGLQYQRWVYPLRARLFIATTWLIGCVVGFLPIMGWSGETYNGRQCWFITLVPPKLIMLICAIGLIPILIVIVLYSIILYHAIKKVVQLRRGGAPTKNENDLRIFRGGMNNVEVNKEVSERNFFKKIFSRSVTKKPENKAPSKSRAVKIVVLTTGSFIITWVPYFVASFLYVNCDPETEPKRCKSLQILIASPLAILGFVNSLLNPIIYAWWHKGFRSFVKKLWCKKKANKPNVSGPSSSMTDKSTSRKTSTTTDTKNTDVELPMENIDLN